MKKTIKRKLFRFMAVVLTAALMISVLLPMTAISASAYGYGDVEGNTVADVLGMDGELYYQWLSSHTNDTYYLTTPYGDYDRRNPNGDCGGAYGDLDIPGVPAMNCMGLIWHCLYIPTLLSGGDVASIPAYGNGGWYGLYTYDNISRRYFDTDAELLASGYAEYGDIIWMFVENESVRDDNNHICIYVGDGHSDRVLHAVPDEVEIGYLGVDYGQYVVLKGGAIQRLDTPHLRSVSNTTKGPKITWNRVNGGNYYRVFVRSGNKWKTLGTTRSNYFYDKNAQSGQRYTYTVRCVDGRGKYISDYEHNGISNTYYAAPSKFKAIGDKRGIHFSWSAVNGAAKYRVYRRTAGGAWEVISKTTETSVFDANAQPGIPYLYTVRVLDAQGNTVSDYNSPIKAYIINDTPVINEYSVGNKGLNLKWNSVRGAEQYAVFKKVGASWRTIGYTNTNSYTCAPDFDAETLYTVRCVNDTHNAMTSGYDRNGCPVTARTAPSISGMEAAANGIKLVIDTREGDDRYRIYRKEGSGGWQKVGDTTEGSYVDTTAQIGKTYTYTVRVVTADGAKLLSGFDTKGWLMHYAATPTAKATAVEGGVRLTWDAVDNAKTYRIFVKQDGKWRGLLTTKNTSYLYRNVEDGKSYTFTVRCIDTTKWFNSYYSLSGVTVKYTDPAATGVQIIEPDTEPETEPATEAVAEPSADAATEAEQPEETQTVE